MMNSARVCLLIFTLVLAPLAARAQTAPGGGDRTGPGRIVSLGGSITEIIYELGLGDALIAVDSTSTYPDTATRLPGVGYLRTLSAEPILAMQPDLILASEDAGPPIALEQIRGAGIPLAVIPDTPGVQGLLDKIGRVGQAIGRAAEAAELQARIESEFSRVRDMLAGIEDRPSLVFFLSAGQGAPMAAGRGTAADKIIELAGGRNAIDGYANYKSLSPEEIVARNPDYLLVDEGSLQRMGGLEAFLARPEIRSTDAAQNGRVVAMDALFLLGFGPRAPQAVRELATAIHPDINGGTGTRP